MSQALLQLHNASKSFGTKTLFSGAGFVINAGEHVGVIGPNGAGKSTLMRTIVGEETLDSGTVTRSSDLRLGYLAQYDHASIDLTVEEFAVQGAVLAPWDLKKLGRGLGLSEESFARPLSTLSGGYRMRAKLLRLLGQQPNLMLLDEPTNYLDLETLLVLESFLQDYQGAFLLISHDREFLKRTTDHILELESGDIVKFPGNIDDYFEQKLLLQEQLQQRALSLQAKRAEIETFAARFGAKASKARQVQSRLKRLDKMETIEVKPLPVGAKIRIPDPTKSGKLTLRLSQGEVGYAERTILPEVNLEILSGDHVGVVGLNGAGKSTLLKSLSGQLPLKAGALEYGHQASLSYYSQHVGEQLNAASTVFESLAGAAGPDTKTQAILDLAGSLLFSGHDVEKRIASLSGGEKARVALGQVLLQRCSGLILDEPTNHLDFYTVEALTQALASYPGTLIVVSHDQGFIRRITTKIIEVKHGRVSTYPGSYDEYVWSLQRGVLSEGATASHAAPSAKNTALASEKSGAAQDWQQRKARDSRLRQITKRLLEVEKKIESGQAELVRLSESAYDQKVATELATVQSRQDALEAEWIALIEEQEQLNATLN